MTVEHAPCRVGNRVLLIVAFGQHGIKRGNRAATGFGVTGALHQFRQFGEHRRRVTFGRRRLTDGQGDFPLGLGESGEGIHQQQDIFTLVPKVFGNPRAVHGGTQTHQGRVIGR